LNSDLGEVTDNPIASEKKSTSKISEAKSKYHLRAQQIINKQLKAQKLPEDLPTPLRNADGPDDEVIVDHENLGKQM
jgi:hypothetical protein